MGFKQFIQVKTQQFRTFIALVKMKYAEGKKLFFQFVAFMKSSESDPWYAAAGYVPFIGWLIPLYIRENSQLCQKSAKQGLLLSLTAVIFLFCMFFIELFIPRSIKIVSFALIILTYFFNVGYLALSASGMYHAVYKRIIRIPVISDRTEKMYL